jgi:hypothetical protein
MAQTADKLLNVQDYGRMPTGSLSQMAAADQRANSEEIFP